MNGHKFVQRQFYQIILCAFCSEFLLNATGYQCEDCRYTCHKKCYEKVVTKCISKSTSGVRFRVSLKELLEGWLIEGVRMMTRTKLTTGFHIVSKQLRISAQIGAVTVVLCLPWEGKTQSVAPSVVLPVMRIALTLSRISVVCRWRRRISSSPRFKRSRRTVVQAGRAHLNGRRRGTR